MPRKKKPARWAFLDELDGRPVDTTPVRSLYRPPAAWEWVLYGLTAVLWVVALFLALTRRYGSWGLIALSISMLCLRTAVYEVRRSRRCKASLLGTVESVTRRPLVRKNARYPVIRFAVDGVTYCAYGRRATHPSTIGNEEWVSYNPSNPADAHLTSDSALKLSLILTPVTAILGILLLMMELS